MNWAGRTYSGAAKVPLLVPVNRLDDWLSRSQVREVLLEDVQVVALGVQRREPALGTLPAVVAVVVVGRRVRDLLLAEDSYEAARERGLAGGRVADDPEQNWAGHQTVTVPVASTPGSLSKSTRAQRISSAAAPSPIGGLLL